MSNPEQQSPHGTDEELQIEPYELTILSKKIEAISRDVTQSVLRSARSGVINIARDFSSAITLYDGRQLMINEGLPGHLGNIGLTPKYTLEHVDDISPGDCFLTNSPFAGNTHHADYTIYVPVFIDGEPLFWVLNRAHQADIGASVPSTYLPEAKDIYEEAMHFPAVRIQEDYEDKDDIVRMLKLNIRLGDSQWYGDYLAQVAAVRTGEEKLEELCEEYGIDKIKSFSEEWLAYGERMMRSQLRELPDQDLERTSYADPIQTNDAAPDGVSVNVKISIDPDEERIHVDVTDNPDSVPAGYNLCEATTAASIYAGIFNNLPSEIPHNEGSISRIEIEMDEGKVVGKAEYPDGTSLATSNIASTLLNAVQSAFGQLGEPFGMAEGNTAMPVNWHVISGTDFRRDDAPYANKVFLTAGGGPAVHGHDGWLTYGTPTAGAVINRNSIEISEQKFPLHYHRDEILPDTGGPGKWRGAPTGVVEFSPRRDPVTVAWTTDHMVFPARGILDGEPGAPLQAYKLTDDGERFDFEETSLVDIEPEETLGGTFGGAGGYGEPLDRDPERVVDDVREGFVTVEGARKDYGVVVEGEGTNLTYDEEKTRDLRAKRSEGD